MTVAGEIALGIATNLVGEALKRPFQAISSELRRKDLVSKALTDRHNARDAASERSSEALEDLARIIGNGHGKLDSNVAAFIRELRKTAIPETMANAALCGSNYSALFPAFDAFYQRFKKLPFTSRELFDALHVACSERVDAVQDKNLLDILRAQHTELVEQIEQLCASLCSAKQSKLTFDEFKDARLKVARAIEAANRYTNVETLQGTKKFKLKSLAIPGRLSKLTPAEISSAKMGVIGETQSFLPFRRDFDRAVILGDPGGGKSTLTQLLCVDLSSIIVLEDSNPERKDFDPRDLKTPLKLVLRSYESKVEQNPSYTFFEFLKDDIKVALDNNEYLAEQFVLSLLSTGEAVIIFDGLDEILDLGSRRNIVSLIEQFSEIYAACPILVTSRLVGYRDAPLCDDFAAYGLARFNDEEIVKYCSNAIKAISGEKQKQAELKSQQFLKQTSKIGGDLRENPLMLGLMVQIFVYRGDVPSNRPEVYKECATLMFEKWDGRRDIVPKDVPQNDMELLDVFGYVASRTFGDAHNEEGVAKDWLIDELRTHFLDWYIDKASANRAAKSLVEFLTGRAWVMSEVGSGVFKFTHRTFLEYFYARHLISESLSISDLISRSIAPHIRRNERVVISHLALHMATFRDGGKSKQAIDEIGRILDKDLKINPDEELPILEFSASSLEYLVIPEKNYLDITTVLMERLVSLGANHEPAAMSIIWTLFQSAKSRLELVKVACRSVFDRHLHGAPTREMLFCICVLGTKNRTQKSSRSRFIYPPIEKGVLWSALEDIRKSHKEFLFSLANKNVEVAKLYTFAYGEGRKDFYSKHGVKFIETTNSELSPYGFEQALSFSIDMASTSFIRSSFYTSEVEPDSEVIDCLEFVKSVADDFLSGKIHRLSPCNLSSQRVDRIEHELERAVRNIWQSKEVRKKSQQARERIAQFLICIFLVSESLSRGRSEGGRGGMKKSDAPAPLHILQRMVEQTGDTIYNGALLDWMKMWGELRSQDMRDRRAMIQVRPRGNEPIAD